eukprot:11677695-Heterocapsa_arctica.AAC.1
MPIGLWVGAQGSHAVYPKLPPAATYARWGSHCAGVRGHGRHLHPCGRASEKCPGPTGIL